MFLYLLLLFGSGYTFSEVIQDEDFMFKGDTDAMRNLIFSSFTPENVELVQASPIENDGVLYLRFIKYLEGRYLKRGMTFNIYDKKMNDLVQVLFGIMQNVNKNKIVFFDAWAEYYIDNEIYDYVCRLNILFSQNKIFNNFIHKTPPFLQRPNYYVNSETIIKGMRLMLSQYTFEEKRASEIFENESIAVIKTNYSGWNLPSNGCHEELRYFREDIGLNSYYYSQHLMHPFWMNYTEMKKIDPRNSEHYYYVHQQLIARYLLETEHLNKESSPYWNTLDCKNVYNPYLMYDNGLPFPITVNRFSTKSEADETVVRQIDILLKECIARGVIITDSGTIKNVTGVTDMEEIARFVLKNLDSLETGKKIRDIFGGPPKEDYMERDNPAPSVLYNYQTALRDSVYWNILNLANVYFKEYKSIFKPYDFSPYNERDIEINTSGNYYLTTCFMDYQFSLNTFFNRHCNNSAKQYDIQVRQKRLSYVPFKFDFIVTSEAAKPKANIKLFIGPPCDLPTSCWDQYDRYFLLDSIKVSLTAGQNNFTWNPDTSSRFSFDDHFNYINNHSTVNRYNFFKFPNNLILPRGTKNGIELSLFVIVSTIQLENNLKKTPKDRYYNYLLDNGDLKPFGFPFHHKAKNYQLDSKNYQFRNVTIYHNEEDCEKHVYK